MRECKGYSLSGDRRGISQDTETKRARGGHSRPGRHTERNKSGQKESQRTRGTNKLKAQRDKSGHQIKTGELEDRHSRSGGRQGRDSSRYGRKANERDTHSLESAEGG
jgi:hypothetical protein